jgi:RHH-type proline utilization regulon transcriptional repressor/proline dehydrogenase/delta 1-pyrroline-5-carboxylate dehydrogenase
MDWAIKNEDFKVQMFRFVDVLPYLSTSESLSRHIEEYFAGDDSNIPDVLKWGATKTKFGGGLVAKVLNKTIRSNIESMARQFIIGQEAKEAVKGIKKLRKDGFAFVLDLLGEATVSEVESAAYRDGYLEVLNAIHKELERPGQRGGRPGLGPHPQGQRGGQALGLLLPVQARGPGGNRGRHGRLHRARL